MFFDKLDKYGRVSYLISLGVMVVAQNFAISELAELLGQDYGDYGVVENWWLPVLVSPIVETLIFQVAIYWILNLYDVRDAKIITLSGVLFGSAHFRGLNSLVYMVSAILAGCIFSWVYVRRRNMRSSCFQAFLDVTFVHAFNNGIVFAISVL